MKGCCQLQAKVCARLLVNCLFKLAQEKSVVRWTDRPAMTIAVDLGRKASKTKTKKAWTNENKNANLQLLHVHLQWCSIDWQLRETLPRHLSHTQKRLVVCRL